MSTGVSGTPGVATLVGNPFDWVSWTSILLKNCIKLAKKIVKRKFIRYLIISAVRSLITCVLWSDIRAGRLTSNIRHRALEQSTNTIKYQRMNEVITVPILASLQRLSYNICWLRISILLKSRDKQLSFCLERKTKPRLFNSIWFKPKYFHVKPTPKFYFHEMQACFATCNQFVNFAKL